MEPGFTQLFRCRYKVHFRCQTVFQMKLSQNIVVKQGCLHFQLAFIVLLMQGRWRLSSNILISYPVISVGRGYIGVSNKDRWKCASSMLHYSSRARPTVGGTSHTTQESTQDSLAWKLLDSWVFVRDRNAIPTPQFRGYTIVKRSPVGTAGGGHLIWRGRGGHRPNHCLLIGWVQTGLRSGRADGQGEKSGWAEWKITH